MTDNVMAAGKSPDVGAPTQMDSLHRAVFGLVVGTLLAVLSSFVIVWISDDVAEVISTTARSFAWHSLVAWAESSDAVVHVAQGLAFTVTSFVGLAAAILVYRRYRRLNVVNGGGATASDESPEEPVSTKSAISWFITSATFVGWVALFVFCVDMFLFVLPETFFDGAIRVVQILLTLVGGIGSGGPFFDRIESIDNSLHLLIIVSALYFYGESEIKRCAKKA